MSHMNASTVGSASGQNYGQITLTGIFTGAFQSVLYAYLNLLGLTLAVAYSISCRFTICIPEAMAAARVIVTVSNGEVNQLMSIYQELLQKCF